MRYYDIQITNPSDGTLIKQYTSLINGSNVPNALDIEIDVFSYIFAQPGGGSYVRVWGIPLSDIAQASNFVGMNIQVSAGMQMGLPLATPGQSGVILRGQVQQALGNWINTDMTLDLFALPFVGSVALPANIVVSWKAGTPLEVAIQTTLRAAFPNFQLSVSLNPNLVLSSDQTGYYSTLTELAQWIKQKSKAVIGGNYPGVDISIIQNSINVYDGTTKTTPKPINFIDLIGQPTWIDFPAIQVKTVMRADISVSDYVTLPNTIATTTQQSLINTPLGTPIRSNSAFQGMYQVQLARHVGRFRQPDAGSWVSIFNALPVLQ